MSTLFALLLMIFLHIVDDYYLQGWLASAKQKKWWTNNAPQPLYKFDYLWALMMHSFSWSFMIMLPVAAMVRFDVGTWFMVAVVVNMLVHALVDDLKANKVKINLIVDQSIHMVQIIVTWLLLVR